MTDISKECFGEFNPDGSVKSEPRLFVSGRPFVVGMPSIRERVSNSPYFYRVEAGDTASITEEQRELWQTAAPQTKAVKYIKPEEGRKDSE